MRIATLDREVAGAEIYFIAERHDGFTALSITLIEEKTEDGQRLQVE